MGGQPAAAVTDVLRAWRGGDPAALERLAPLVYDELHRLARVFFRGERPGHTLQPTALVNEAYLKLIDIKRVDWQDRAHFFAMAARQMRRILVDAARARRYQKRGGGAVRVTLIDAMVKTSREHDVEALDDALEALGKIDARKAQVVELRFFGGLNNEEIGAALHVSTDTVMRDWSLAKAWLLGELRKDTAPHV
jgi:RNA polymerase sigma-70 factor (ECF subfamily)